VILPDRDEIRQLAAAHPSPGVSITLPLHRLMRPAREDAVVLSRLLDRAAADLVSAGHADRDVRTWLAPARALTQDEGFWQRQAEALQIYLSPDGMMLYELPYRFAEQLWIGPRFAVRPLVPLWSDDTNYFVLALSIESARLYAARHFRITPVRVDLPQGLASIDDGDHQDTLQRHERVLFGHGTGHDDHKVDIARYLTLLDAAVCASGATSAPLVLCAVEFVASIYRSLTHHPDVVGTAFGNFDEATPSELSAATWPVMSARLQVEQETLARRIRDAAGNGRAAVGLDAIVPAAAAGRVITLVADATEPVWGRFAPGDRRAEMHSKARRGDDDLVDLAAALTMTHGGDVVARRVDARTRAGALLRY
jgi:hypothetical protein